MDMNLLDIHPCVYRKENVGSGFRCSHERVHAAPGATAQLLFRLRSDVYHSQPHIMLTGFLGATGLASVALFCISIQELARLRLCIVHIGRTGL